MIEDVNELELLGRKTSSVGLASVSFQNERFLRLVWMDNTRLFNSLTATAGTLSLGTFIVTIKPYFL